MTNKSNKFTITKINQCIHLKLMSCGGDFIFIDFDKKMCQISKKESIQKKKERKVKTTKKKQYV